MSCLSVTPHPDIVEFDSADVFGGINMELEDVNNKDLERVQPLAHLDIMKFSIVPILDQKECPKKAEDQGEC